MCIGICLSISSVFPSACPDLEASYVYKDVVKPTGHNQLFLPARLCVAYLHIQIHVDVKSRSFSHRLIIKDVLLEKSNGMALQKVQVKRSSLRPVQSCCFTLAQPPFRLNGRSGDES